MKSLEHRLILAIVLTCAAGSVARAQEPPQPTQEGQKPKPGAVEVQPWSFSLGVHETYESDVQFAGTEGNGDWSRGVAARLGHSWKLRRGTFDLGGDANQAAYMRASGMNRVTYGLASALAYSVTRRFSLHASETLNRSYAQDSSVLTSTGLLFPRVLTRTNVASTDMTYNLTRRMQIDGSVSATTVNFEGPQFSSGSSITTRIHLTRQIVPTQSIGVSVGNTISTGITGDIQGLLGTWQGTFGRTLTLNAAIGVRPYTLYGVSGRQYATGGSFGMSSRFARNQTFAATYERAVEQAYGFNRTHLANRYNANYGFIVGRRLTLDGTASYGRNTYPQIADLVLDGKTLMLGAQYLLGAQLYLGANYGLWIRHETGAPPATTYRPTVSLSYGRSWR